MQTYLILFGMFIVVAIIATLIIGIEKLINANTKPTHPVQRFTCNTNAKHDWRYIPQIPKERR